MAALKEQFRAYINGREPINRNGKLAGYTTIQQTTLSTKKKIANESSDSAEGKGSEMDTPSDPVEDPLKWLDDGLSDCGHNHREFDLALQFDIRHSG
jgi:hypothetical protein